ncbi:neuropeptide F-like [Centruroides vittatus]|uniref:neuropeptide F-like n=1 Tax=Centruroides vittatus TaxID=120091 RepID=UPI0035101DAD
MNRIHKNIFFGIISVGILLALFSERAEARPAYVDVDNVYETLRYLEELDRLYSQKARPRFGRSADKYQSMFPKFPYENGKNEMKPSFRR